MDYFAINKNSYFEHHGILGQKWGKKNGPPYPLDYSKLSAEERAKDKERAINEGDISTVSYKKNRNYYSDAELNSVINRYNLNARLSELQAKSELLAKGKSKSEQLTDAMGKISDAGNKLANAIDSGTKVYNSVAKIMNAVGDANMPIIGQDKAKKVSTTIRNIDTIAGTITETVKDSEGNTYITKKPYGSKKEEREAKKEEKAAKKEEKAAKEMADYIKKTAKDQVKPKKEKAERYSGDVVDSGYDWDQYYQPSNNYRVGMNNNFLLEDKRKRR